MCWNLSWGYYTVFGLCGAYPLLRHHLPVSFKSLHIASLSSGLNLGEQRKEQEKEGLGCSCFTSPLFVLFSRAESNTGNGKTLTVSSHDLRALESRFHFRNPIVVNKKQKTKKRKEKQTNKKKLSLLFS